MFVVNWFTFLTTTDAYGIPCSVTLRHCSLIASEVRQLMEQSLLLDFLLSVFIISGLDSCIRIALDTCAEQCWNLCKTWPNSSSHAFHTIFANAHLPSNYAWVTVSVVDMQWWHSHYFLVSAFPGLLGTPVWLNISGKISCWWKKTLCNAV